MKKKLIDDIGRTIFTSDMLFDLLMEGKDITGLLCEECFDTTRYNDKISDFDKILIYNSEIKSVLKDEYDMIHSSEWFTPEDYKNIDLDTWLFDRCKNDIEKERISEELLMFKERNLLPLLKHLIFMVDYFRNNKIVWGVGRGSSVSSFILYIIGIHKVDSIKYNLNIKDFLK